jgi:hypothetical protein
MADEHADYVEERARIRDHYRVVLGPNCVWCARWPRLVDAA